MNTVASHDLLFTIINDLLVKHKDGLRRALYRDVSEDFWQELRLNLRYSSPIVSGQINYVDACKWAHEQVNHSLFEAVELCIQHKAGRWRVRFIKNKRNLTLEDFDEGTNPIPPSDNENLAFLNSREAELACKKLWDSYHAALMVCPALELIPLDKKGEKIDWLSYEYQPNP